MIRFGDNPDQDLAPEIFSRISQTNKIGSFWRFVLSMNTLLVKIVTINVDVGDNTFIITLSEIQADKMKLIYNIFQRIVVSEFSACSASVHALLTVMERCYNKRSL